MRKVCGLCVCVWAVDKEGIVCVCGVSGVGVMCAVIES